MEIWKSVKGFEGLYEVSNLGRVKRITGRVKVLKLAAKKNGYLEACLSRNQKAKFVSVHRLVAEAFCERDDERKTVVDHINCNKHDNRASNLEWVTDRENKDRAMKNKCYYNPNKKPILCVELNKVFNGSYEAADYINNLKFGNSKKIRSMAGKIRSSCLGFQTKAYGFTFKYL